MKGKNPLLLMLAKDKRMIGYRPEFKAITGSVTSAILLQQIYHWWSCGDGKPFYKFKIKCDSKFYKDGDSWTEELGFSTGEFDTALDKIAVKVKKHGERPEGAIVWFWTDNDRRTYYDINIEYFSELLSKLYVGDLKSVGKTDLSRGEDGRFSPVNRENGFTTVTPENGFTKNGKTDLRNSENPIYLQYSTENTANKTTDRNFVGDATDFVDYEAQIKDSKNSGASEKAAKEKLENEITAVLEKLNLLSGRSLAVQGDRAEDNRNLVRKLLKKKYTVDEIELVIEIKCFEWVNNPQMFRYLHPSTLFSNKFQTYLDLAKELQIDKIKQAQFKNNINGNASTTNKTARNGHQFDPARTAYMESLLD